MAERSVPVKYELAFTGDGVQLIVDRASIRDPLIALDFVQMDLIERMVDDVDFGAISDYFDDPTDEPIIIAPAQPEPAKGEALAQLSEDGNKVLLLVEPPMGRSPAATLKDALTAIKKVGAGEFYLDLERVDNLVTTLRYREYVEVGERRDGSFEFKFSRDMTEAYVIVTPSYGGRRVTPEIILEAMKRHRICAGASETAVYNIFAHRTFHQPVMVACGRPAENGQNARLELFFDPDSRSAKPTINEDGQVDFKELNLFVTVEKGTRLAKKHPATPGKKGLTVFGKVLEPRPGRDIPNPLGLNVTYLESEPGVIVAAASGQPKLINRRVCIIEVLRISGDVDYGVGNIDFTGSVNIEGNVLSGFSIKARSDIIVGGSVEACTLDAGGSIKIRGGIVGQEKAMIVCRDNFVRKFVDKANIYCDGDVVVDESILFSKVSAGGEVMLSGRKGFIIGGVVRAGKTVQANQVGAPLQSPTRIEIGGSPSLRQEMEDLENEIRRTQEEQEKQSKSLTAIEKKKAEGNFDEKTRSRELALTRERFALLSKLRQFHERKEQLEERIARIKSSNLKLHVRDRLYPGVKIYIKNALINIADELVFSTFYERDDRIDFMPYDGIDAAAHKEKALDRMAERRREES